MIIKVVVAHGFEPPYIMGHINAPDETTESMKQTIEWISDCWRDFHEQKEYLGNPPDSWFLRMLVNARPLWTLCDSPTHDIVLT